MKEGEERYLECNAFETRGLYRCLFNRVTSSDTSRKRYEVHEGMLDDESSERRG
jgi:hypothetical protein